MILCSKPPDKVGEKILWLRMDGGQVDENKIHVRAEIHEIIAPDIHNRPRFRVRFYTLPGDAMHTPDGSGISGHVETVFWDPNNARWIRKKK